MFMNAAEACYLLTGMMVGVMVARLIWGG